MFQIEVAADGRWWPMAGAYATREEAEAKVAQYLMSAVRYKQPQYRVVRKA
jgi:hypothetical protein